jgi:hypothetical protein
MVPAAEPPNRHRALVVVVVPVNIGIAADFARLPLDQSLPQRGSERRVRPRRHRMRRVPAPLLRLVSGCLRTL